MTELWQLLDDPSYEVSSVQCSIGASFAQYKSPEGTPSESKVVNVVIASYVTALGRIELWKLMNSLGDRLLYVDTDSAIFTTAPGQINPPVGTYLGELTDEIKDAYGPTARGVNFVSTGPKSYCLQIERSLENGDKEIINMVKSKGFSLKGLAKELITFEGYEGLVTAETDFIEIPNTLFKGQYFGGVSLDRKSVV